MAEVKTNTPKTKCVCWLLKKARILDGFFTFFLVLEVVFFPLDIGHKNT
jgi:hypothetical protein